MGHFALPVPYQMGHVVIGGPIRQKLFNFCHKFRRGSTAGYQRPAFPFLPKPCCNCFCQRVYPYHQAMRNHKFHIVKKTGQASPTRNNTTARPCSFLQQVALHLPKGHFPIGPGKNTRNRHSLLGLYHTVRVKNRYVIMGTKLFGEKTFPCSHYPNQENPMAFFVHWAQILVNVAVRANGRLKRTGRLLVYGMELHLPPYPPATG